MTYILAMAAAFGLPILIAGTVLFFVRRSEIKADRW